MAIRGKTAALIGAFLGVVACSACKPGEGKIAFVGASMWDGTGNPPLADAVIIIAGDSIEAVGPAETLEPPRGAEIRRVDGKFIIPGLIDSHVHPERWMLRALASYGVTTIRSGGGDPDSAAVLRDDIDAGRQVGPRMYVAGAEIDGIPPHRDDAVGVRTPVEARRAVDEVKLIQGSHVMISTKINRTVLQALLDEAGLLLLPVGGHLGRVDAVTAAREGITSIEHLSGVVEATVPNPADYLRAHRDYYGGWTTTLAGWNRLDSAGIDRTARRLAGTNVVMVPTLVNQISFGNLQNIDFIGGLDLTAVPEAVVTAWDIPGVVRSAGITSTDFANFRLGIAKQEMFIRRFRAAGGVVVAGSNTPAPLLAPGASLHDELAALVEAGLSPQEALLSATRDAAALLRADSLGVLAAGRPADLVVLNGNPLTDIRNTKSIDQVVLRGQPFSRLDLIR